MASADELPPYATMLSAYHRAYQSELRRMLGDLPLDGGERVLDVACGDGFFSRLLADRVGSEGQVVAIDISRAFLNLASDETESEPPVELLQANLERLPISEGSFDLAWCAQSLYSLPDPIQALSLMRRAVRPGGVVAVLENDSLHHVLLPWPIEVELAVRIAELRSFIKTSDEPRKYYVGRQLCQAFHRSGLVGCRRQAWASNRQAPLGADERTFLGAYLENLRGRVRPHLRGEARKVFERLVDAEGGDYILDDPDLTVTCLDHLVWGSKPEGIGD